MKNELAPTTHFLQCLTEDNADVTISIIEQENNLTIDKLLENDTLVYTLKKQFSEKQLLISCRSIILHNAQSFKYAEKMTLAQASILSADLLTYFKWETFEDIVLMFKMARTGQLGDTKGRLDSDTIFKTIVPAYMDFKAKAREKQYSKEKNAKGESFEMSEESREKFQGIIKNLGMKKPEEKKEAPAINHHQLFITKLKYNIQFMDIASIKDLLKKGQEEEVFSDVIPICQSELEIRNNNGTRNQ